MFELEKEKETIGVMKMVLVEKFIEQSLTRRFVLYFFDKLSMYPSFFFIYKRVKERVKYILFMVEGEWEGRGRWWV